MWMCRVSVSIFALSIALSLAACFEEPVREDLVIEVLSDGRAIVTVTTRLAVPDLDDDAHLSGRSLDQRLDQLRGDLESGNDPWTPRFEQLEATALRTTLDHHDSRLVRARRRAIVGEPSAVERFFADTLIQAHVAEVDGWSEISFQPLAAGRATRRQRRELDRGMNEWSDALAVYLATAGELWNYLEDHPDRARPCFLGVFGDVIENEQTLAEGEALALSGQEEALISALGDAMGDALSVLVIDADQSYSLDEISRLAYDPFPAPLTVQLPSRPTEIEGFVDFGGDRWGVPPLSLWQALRRLEGRWLEPDPLVAYVDIARADENAAFDLDGFASAPRTYRAPPTGPEIREAIEEQLRPAPVYRALVKLSKKSTEADEALLGED